jgi:hypothetical protein
MYTLDHYTIGPTVDREIVWAEAQAHGCYIRFDGYGDTVIIIDSRSRYNTLFQLRWSEHVTRVEREGWID